MLLFLSIIIIIFIILVFLPIRCYTKRQKPLLKLYEDIEPNLKTGDIILYSCVRQNTLINHLTYEARTTLLNSHWGHASLVYRNSSYSRPMLIDFTSSKPHAQIRDAETHLRKYQRDNCAFFAVKHVKNELNNEQVKKLFCRYRDKKFSNWINITGVRILLTLFPHTLINNVAPVSHCSEFISKILLDLKILDPSKKSFLYFPEHLSKLPKNSYEQTIPFHFDDVEC